MDEFKKRNVFSGIISRLHYLIIVALTLIVLYFGESNWFYILLAFDAVYIAAYEIYLFKKRKNSKEVSQEIISLLNSPLRKRYGVLLELHEKNKQEISHS